MRQFRKKQKQSTQTVQILHDFAGNNAKEHRQILQSIFAFVNVSSSQSSWQKRAAHVISQIKLYPLEMPPNSLHLCIFSGYVTLHTVFPCLAATSVIHGHNVFPVFLEQMPLKTFTMTHTTYTPSSAWKYHSHTHNTSLSKTIAPGNWGILTRNKAKMNLGNEYFPQYLGPHP